MRTTSDGASGSQQAADRFSELAAGLTVAISRFRFDGAASAKAGA